MSKLIFHYEQTSEKNLRKKTAYKYFPDSKMREEIIKELKNSLGHSIPENVIVEFNFEICLKEYELDSQALKLYGTKNS